MLAALHQLRGTHHDNHQYTVTTHTLTAQAVAAAMAVRLEVGLISAQALERLARHGPNRLPKAPLRSPWRVLLGQFKSILIGVAALAAFARGGG